MKICVCFALLSTGLLAQTPPAPATSPQPAPHVEPGTLAPKTETPPDKVVAKIDGKDWTAAQVKNLLIGFPPQYQKAIAANPERALKYVMVLQELAHQAEFHNLDKEPKTKAELDFARTQILSNAEITNYQNSIDPKTEDERQYFETNKDKFRVGHIKVIYVAYTAHPPSLTPSTKPEDKKSLTEAEAQTKAESLKKQADGGADFGKLARENSDDKNSAEKDGDAGEVTPASHFPPPVLSAIFALKPGEVSAPIREPNGFYLFKLLDLKQETFNDAESKVHQEMMQAQFNEWQKSMFDRVHVEVEDPAFFRTAEAPPIKGAVR